MLEKSVIILPCCQGNGDLNSRDATLEAFTPKQGPLAQLSSSGGPLYGLPPGAELRRLVMSPWLKVGLPCRRGSPAVLGSPVEESTIEKESPWEQIHLVLSARS
jgi:hypothetical protein